MSIGPWLLLHEQIRRQGEADRRRREDEEEYARKRRLKDELSRLPAPSTIVLTAWNGGGPVCASAWSPDDA